MDTKTSNTGELVAKTPGSGIMHLRLLNCLLIIMDLIDTTAKNPPDFIEESLFKALQTVRCFIFTMLSSLLANDEAFESSGINAHIHHRINKLKHLAIYGQVKKVFKHSLKCLSNYVGENKEEVALTSLMASISIIESKNANTASLVEERIDSLSKDSEISKSTGIMVSDKDGDEKQSQNFSNLSETQHVDAEVNTSHVEKIDEDGVLDLSQLFREQKQSKLFLNNEITFNSTMPEQSNENGIHDNKVTQWVKKQKKFTQVHFSKKPKFNANWQNSRKPAHLKTCRLPTQNVFNMASPAHFFGNRMYQNPLPSFNPFVRPRVHIMQQDPWKNRCRYCKKYNHTIDFCPKLADKICENCGKNGHSTEFCKENTKEWRSKSTNFQTKK